MLGLATSTFKTFHVNVAKFIMGCDRFQTDSGKPSTGFSHITCLYVSMSPLTAVEQAEHDRTSVCDNCKANFSSTHCSDIRH